MTELVQVRTPTYRRGGALMRCLKSLQDQTWENWVCDVYDDDPEGSAESVVDTMSDHRIRYHKNSMQKFASRNIDQCFSRANPNDADYFCVVEDDNHLLPDFMSANIALCQAESVGLVLRNQFFEWGAGTQNAKIGPEAVLDGKLTEGRYSPDLFCLSMVADIGVSNGGLFWSRNINSDLEIGFYCTATMQEYMRTYAIADDIWVAMKPLAVWAENGEGTLRDMGDRARYIRRELDLKRSVQKLRRHAWKRAGERNRTAFLQGDVFDFPPDVRAKSLAKALLRGGVVNAPGTAKKLRWNCRGAAIRVLGHADPNLAGFIASRGG